jgi:protein-S-isoprenylcysteine O-methyltransferase Ste14
VLIGFCVLAQCIVVHFTAALSGWQLEKTQHYPTPAYLLIKGPYRFSRNPIYLAEGAIWLGWIVFHGSFMIFAALGLAACFGPVIVRREERGLQWKRGAGTKAQRRVGCYDQSPDMAQARAREPWKVVAAR